MIKEQNRALNSQGIDREGEQHEEYRMLNTKLKPLGTQYLVEVGNGLVELKEAGSSWLRMMDHQVIENSNNPLC